MADRGICTGILVSAETNKWGVFEITLRVKHSDEPRSHRKSFKLRSERMIKDFNGESKKYTIGDRITVFYENIEKYVIDEDTGIRDKWVKFEKIKFIESDNDDFQAPATRSSKPVAPAPAPAPPNEIGGEDAETF